MKIEIHIHHHGVDPCDLRSILLNTENTMASLDELQAEVVTITTKFETLTAQVERNRQETANLIEGLEAQIGGGAMTTTPEFDALFADMKVKLGSLEAAVQQADDDVPTV